MTHRLRSILRSLRFRILALAVVLVIAATALTAIYTLRRLENMTTQELEQEGTLLGYALAAGITSASDVEDVAGLQALVDRLTAAYADVAEVNIFLLQDDTSFVVASNIPDNVEEADTEEHRDLLAVLESGQPVVYIEREEDNPSADALASRLPGGIYAQEVLAGQRFLAITTPLEVDGQVVGGIGVKLSLAELDHQLVVTRRAIGLAAALEAALVLLLLYLILDRQLMRPLAALASGMRSIAGGNLKQRLPAPSSDELNALSRTFNDMAEQLARVLDEKDTLISDLDAFAHTVAHDLKNPVGAMTNYAQMSLLFAERITDAQRTEHLDAIVRGGYRAVRIINELLLLSSVSKLEQVQTAPLNMARIVAEVQARLESLIETNRAKIIVPDNWPVVESYAPWVEEIWSNYVSNAIKYGGMPPRVELGASSGKDSVRFWVRDNGRGLTGQEQNRLFTQFTRLAPGKADGHGLGLSIVKRIAEKLGGEVGVKSIPGAGSEFFFTLPATPLPTALQMNRSHETSIVRQ